MKFFRVRNFEKFQHYKDRNPPWIKLYRSILDDPRFFRLAESDRFFLLGLFIVASQNDNQMPADQQWLKTRLMTRRTIPLELLVTEEWLEWTEPPGSKSASKPASTVDSKHASKSASTNASTALAFARSRETESETESEPERQSQKQKKETEIPIPQIAQTPEVSRPIEANGRAVEGEVLKALEQSFSLVEAHLRRNIEELSYSAYYAGIRPIGCNSHEVFLAVPGTLIALNEGNPELVSKVLTHTCNAVNKQFLRGRILRVVSLVDIEANA